MLEVACAPPLNQTETRLSPEAKSAFELPARFSPKAPQSRGDPESPIDSSMMPTAQMLQRMSIAFIA
jgi:hypothetical protein